VDFVGIKASIGHSRFAEQQGKDAVVDQLREAIGERPSVDTAWQNRRRLIGAILSFAILEHPGPNAGILFWGNAS